MEKMAFSLLLVFYATFSHTGAQNSSGYEFIVTFMDTYRIRDPLGKEILLASTLPHDVTVNVTFKDNIGEGVTNMSVTIPSDGQYRISLPHNIVTEGTGKSKKNIHMLGDGPFSVFAINMEDPSTDGYLALPVNSLGMDYYAVTYGICKHGCQFAVTSGSEPTNVHIELPSLESEFPVYFDGVLVDIRGSVAVTLGSYETFQLKTSHDLTGSYIHADKPVVFYSGNSKTGYPDQCCSEHLVEQIPSVQTWGQTFLTPVTPGRQNFLIDFYRIITSAPNTTVTLPSGTIFLENEGSFAEFNLSSELMCSVSADEPVLLVKFVVGDHRKSPTDPCMMLVIPVEQWITETVATLHERYDVNYVVITGTSDLRETLTLNGQAMPEETVWLYHNESGLLGAYLLLTNETNVIRVSGLTTFSAYLMSGRHIESYCMPVGMRLLPINTKWTRTIPPAYNPCLGLYNESHWQDKYSKLTTESITTTGQECPTNADTTGTSTLKTTSTSTLKTSTSTQVSTEQLQVVLARIEKELRLYPPGTSAFRRNMRSYTVNDYVSEVMGWVAVGILCLIFFVFLCIDRERLVRDLFGGVQPDDSRV
ncbi:IgGFc-binding protein-like [Haliotis asinina]|uniref:IgGFc-binding protein-like n=1 Tax=Haliotis asinina TaxID=109174 RepID=UPI0035322B98